MARNGFKRRIEQVIPPAAERSSFVLVTCAILSALFLFWQPMPAVVWEVSSPVLRGILVGISLTGFLGVVFVTFLIDLFGLKQVVFNYTGRPMKNPSFQVRSLYRISRHPLYLCFALALLTTGYMIIGVQFEERGLIAAHGEAYVDYRRKVPVILPMPGRSMAPIASESTGVDAV